MRFNPARPIVTGIRAAGGHTSIAAHSGDVAVLAWRTRPRGACGFSQLLIAGAATVFALVVPSTLGAAGDANAQREKEIHRLADPLIDANLAPGMVVGVYDNGTTEIYGLGHFSPTDPKVPDGDTLYEIGSVSKVFTGLLLADAVSRDQVKLDAPLSTLLPASVKAPQRDGKEITLEHLATHTSGLPRIPTDMAADADDPYADYDAKRLYAFLDGLTPATVPGSQYAYSNLGAGLLGQLLADRAKLTYAELLRERITKPLKMTDTVIELDASRQARLAPPHADGRPAHNWAFGALAGCGAIRSTASDMLKLVAAHADPGSTPLADAVALASTRRRDVENTKWGMALGWHYAADNVTLWHNGQTAGYAAAVFVSPMHKKGVVVLANGACDKVTAVAEKILQSMLGMTVEPVDVRTEASVSEQDLERLVGDYKSTFGFNITVTREGGALFARVTGQQALRVFAESPTKFFYRAVPAELEFELKNSGGKAASVTLLQNGMKYVCTRVAE
jgi:CubicO group peptidase (beta-lactamase class C family)